MCALSARHCRPLSSSIKKSILNWRDWLLEAASCVEFPAVSANESIFLIVS